MARTPEPDVRITEGVQPAAQVYDTYVRPATPAPSPLHDVAAALAPLSSELFGLAAEEQAKANAADKAAGEAAFWNDNAAGAAEGVASGKIPADRSPKFMEGYAGMAGLNDAASIQQSIGPDYQSLDKTSTDPAAFDKWFFPYVRSKANPALMSNPAYSRAWAQRVASLHAQYGAQFVQDRSNALKAGAFQNFTGSLGNTVDDQYYGSGGAPDTVKLAQTIQDIRTAAYQAGLPKADVDKAVVDVVATKAVETKNPALLDVLKSIPADPSKADGVQIGETEYGNHKALETRHSIQTLLLQDQERQRKEDDRKDKQASNEALAGVEAKWAQDANYVPSTEEIRTISKTRPDFLSTMAALRENILKNDSVEDPREVKQLYEDIYKSGDPQGEIAKAIRMGSLKTASSIDNAVKFGNLVENYNKSGGAFKITEDPSFKGLEQAVITHTKDPKWAGSMFAEQGLTDAGRAALFDARMQAMQWQMANPNAGPMERAKFLYELQEGILKRIQPGVDLGGTATAGFKPTYSPAPGAPSTETAKPQGSPQAAPSAPAALTPAPAPQNAPAVTPAPANGQQGLIDTPQKAAAAIGKLPAAPRFEDLAGMGVSPVVVQGIQAAAQAAGRTPQDFINEVYKRTHQPGQQQRSEAAPPADNGGGGGGPLAFAMPGGGEVQVRGVSPEVAGQIRQMVERMGRLGGGSPQQQGGTEVVNQARVERINALPVHSTIEKVAQETGFPADKLKAIVSIESGGRANASTGSYHGLLQLSHDEFRRYGGGGGNIMDPEANLRAGVRSLQEKQARFAAEFGREPSATELYLMHQQGEAGLRSHEAHLDQPAWQSMRDTGEGRSKGDKWAKAAVWGNVPSDMRHLFGSVDNITSRQFIAVWMHKLEGVPYEQALAEVGRGGSTKQVASAE